MKHSVSKALKDSLSKSILDEAIDTNKAKEGDAYADGLVVRAPI